MYMNFGKKLIFLLLISLMRKLLRYILVKNNYLLYKLETLLLNTGITKTKQIDKEWPYVIRILINYCIKINHDETTRSLYHVHRQIIRKEMNPVWRDFVYKGLNVRFDIRQNTQWDCYFRGTHDPGVRYWLLYYTYNNSCVFDIGANVGIFSLELSSKMNKEGFVYAIEPHPNLFEILKYNIEINNLSQNCKPYNFAFGSVNSNRTLYVPRYNIGASSLMSSRDIKDSISVEVHVFDDWFNFKHNRSIDVIKIDVEGAEEHVIRGMLRYLNYEHPVIVFECSPQKSDVNWILNALVLRRYKMWEITSTYPFYKSLPNNISKQLDILCIPSQLQNNDDQFDQTVF